MSDWLSPIVVKDVRQMVRTSQFFILFGLSLGGGLVVALLGGVDAFVGGVTAGAWTFNGLCWILLFIGMVVVPLGGFSSLRQEELQRTFELVRITGLSARRIVIGKVLAQGVRLLTLFSGMTPFLAMSYLLGGISMAQILLFLAMLSLWSLWSCAAGALLSLEKSFSGVLSAVAAVVVYLFGWLFILRVCVYSTGSGAILFRSTGQMFSATIVASALCVITMINVILLAARRLGGEREDHPMALRVGLMAQFLLLLATPVLSTVPVFSYFLDVGSSVYSSTLPAFRVAAVLCCAQIAIEAFYLTTENIVRPKDASLDVNSSGRFPWLTTIFGPGAGGGVAFVLVHMAMLLALGWLVEPGVSTFLVLAAVCGYVCLFTGAPHCLLRWIAPRFSAPLLPRFGTVVFILVFQVVLPLMRRLTAPMKLDVYGYKDLLNPIATLYAWETMDFSFKALVLALGAIGLFTYACLLLIAYHVNARRLADSS